MNAKRQILKGFIIPGDPKPKKNNPIPIIYRDKKNPWKQFFKHMEKGYRILIIPSAIFTKYQKQALIHIPYYKKPFERINLRVLYYRETKRKIDLVNLLEATCDILVKDGIIVDDDSKCVVSTDGSRVFYDKHNPRAEIYIESAEPIPDEQLDIFKKKVKVHVR
ncbi:MAG: RusA family crossover junction endodeoxyribonuclease [Nanoarchaeota archaeon]|nr:RusA family crossover junction endodeoxyribonuclease [Nanoarchaeota archaeon]